MFKINFQIENQIVFPYLKASLPSRLFFAEIIMHTIRLHNDNN